MLGTPNSMVSNDAALQAQITEAYEKGVQKMNPWTDGKFVPEFTANPHGRFLGLAKSIRERRQEKVCIKSPIFQDVNTSMAATDEEPFPGFIYMDAMHFGMGNSCL